METKSVLEVLHWFLGLSIATLAYSCLFASVILSVIVCKAKCSCNRDACCVRDTVSCPAGDQCFCASAANDWNTSVCEDAKSNCSLRPELFTYLFLILLASSAVFMFAFPLLCTIVRKIAAKVRFYSVQRDYKP